VSQGTVVCYASLYNVTVDSVSGSSDGTFIIPIRERGFYRFSFSAPNHRETIIPLYIEHSLDLTVELSQDSVTMTRLVFRDTDSHTAKFYEIHTALAAHGSEYRKSSRGRPDTTGRVKKGAYDWSPYVTELNGQIALERDSLLCQALMIARLTAFVYGDTLSTASAKSILDAIPPTHPYWADAPYNLVVTSVHGDYRSYIDRAAQSHPDRWVRAWLMLVYLAQGRYLQDSVRVRQYAARLISEFPATDFAKMAAPYATVSMRDVTVGSLLPSFSFEALDHSEGQVSNQAFKGKTYLLTFWATWCQPCVNQLPILRDAYSQYAAEGFDVLSVSLDDNRENLAAFLKSRPWFHWPQAHAAGGFNNEFVKRLGVYYVPTAFLIDHTGHVLATSKDLIGPKLDSTLTRIWKQKRGRDSAKRLR